MFRGWNNQDGYGVHSPQIDRRFNAIPKPPGPLDV